MEVDEETEKSPVAEKEDVIKPINRETVHRICSGQVVLSLSIAVKELIENSIDANAKNIEIRLKEYGMDLLEVVDNGSGVREENFEALTLKHYTSKIRQFDDLESICTLGFRGEALSSLCALSDLTVITRHESAEHGTKLKFDNNGKLLSKTPIARPVGTTVSLANLFSTLPVRRKEYVKNYKREFNKMCNLLYAYCLVAKSVKFTCTNQTVKGTNSTVVSTLGTDSIKDNIISIFGPKQISSLIEMPLVKPDETTAQEFNIKIVESDPSPFEFDCYISSVTHGNGRSTADRQFYFINSRPCEPTKLMKLVNEVYRQYNSNQYPFVYLNVIVKSSMVDVNVTPDKRQIFLEKEKLLLATVKTSLIEAFKLFPSTLKVQNLNDSVRSNKRGNEESFLGSFRKKSKGDSEVSPKKNLSILNLKSFKIEKRKNCLEEEKVCVKEETEEVKTIKLLEPKKFEEAKVVIEDENKDVLEKKTDIVVDKLNILKKPDVENETNIMEHRGNDEGLKVEKFSFDNFRSSKSKTNILDETIIEESIACTLTPSKHKFKEPDPHPSTSKSSTNTKQKSVASESLQKKNRKSIEVNFSLSDIKEALNFSEGEENKEVEVKFRSKIDPSSNEKAERELQLQISKDMFAKMKIIGQFNYAFIIAELDGDLFIVDQHATDEKYNFEELQRTTVVESQVLVNPKDLQLTAAHENVLIENIEVFKKNGFNFQIDENAEATKKVKMTKIPLSKNYIFGKDDIDEMIYMLQEGCDTNCRPTRVRGMFASRACRKSVMVGKALSKTDMRKLIDHMGVIDQPWNCPHGRPTMRHLINLNMLHKFN